MERTILEIVREASSDAVAFLKGVETAVKAAKSVRDLIKPGEPSVPAGLRDQVVDLYEQLISLRIQNAALLDALTRAERDLTKRDEFLAEKQRYILKELTPNSLAYVLAEPRGDGEKVVKLCQHCFGNDQKSMLQYEQSDWSFDTLVCPKCGTKARVRNDITMEVLTIPRGRRALDDD